MLWCILGNFWAAVSFLVLWWFWVSDIIYYGFCSWLRWFKTEPPNAYEQDVKGNVVTWAAWTPWGLLRLAFGKAKKSDPIDGYVLEVQAFVGVAIVLVIQGVEWGVF